MAFRVGQKVVYVGVEDNLEDTDYDDAQDWDIGSIFTVSRFYYTSHGYACVELYEVDAPATDKLCAGFCAEAFRPVVERKTDISIFKKMLLPKSSSLETVA